MRDPSEFNPVGKRGKPVFCKGDPIDPKKRLAIQKKREREERIAKMNENPEKILKKLEDQA
ncbi:hypothetical protein HOE67_03020 [Candidatus Peregrinibacteria bacterium]|jgi:hypothetical protein|nr:hypothetical protein [Candidatus Peregrinibacteria bacterium]MBT4056057.1 hypothetical protein [Candidatus Peregrinibacteria bacterium]